MAIKEEDHLLDGQVDQIDNEIDNSGEHTYENVMSDDIDGIENLMNVSIVFLRLAKEIKELKGF